MGLALEKSKITGKNQLINLYCMNEYKKILIIRTGAIGDVIHTSNLFRAIKKLNPEITIHYLTSETIKPLLVENPDLEKVLTIDPKFKSFSSYTKTLSKELKNENICI